MSNGVRAMGAANLFLNPNGWMERLTRAVQHRADLNGTVELGIPPRETRLTSFAWPLHSAIRGFDIEHRYCWLAQAHSVRRERSFVIALPLESTRVAPTCILETI